MRLMMEIKADRRRENLSIVDEVAAIILYEAEVASHRDIVLAERTEDGTLRTFFNIYIYHIAYILFAYPLIFLFGDYGYYWGFKLRDIYRQDYKFDRIDWRAYWAYIFYPYHL